MSIETKIGTGGSDEPTEEYLSQTSTLEGLMIQALIGQLTDIVENQSRNKRVSYENSYKQALTLQSLAQTALMLTDSETIFLHGAKFQDFINRAFLEATLGFKNERPNTPTTIPNSEPGTQPPSTSDEP